MAALVSSEDHVLEWQKTNGAHDLQEFGLYPVPENTRSAKVFIFQTYSNCT